MKKSVNLTPGQRKDIFEHYYKELWTNNIIQEHYLNTEYVYITTTEKLREH